MMVTDPIITEQQALLEIERVNGLSKKTYTDCGPSAKMVWRSWGSGPHLVLIHGGAGSWMHWIKNIEFLAKSHTVWAPDIPGFGESDLPAEHLDADTLFPYVLLGLREVLKDEPFDLVGFSFGGLIAALIAAQRPEQLKRLVLVSIASMGLLSENPVLRPLRGVTDPKERKEILRSNLRVLMLFKADKIDELALAVQLASAPRDRVKNRKLVLTDILFRLCREWNCPAFGIWGRQDFLYRNQLDKLMDASGSLGMRDRVVMEDAGHWVQYEKPNEFNSALHYFLNRPVYKDIGEKHGR